MPIGAYCEVHNENDLSNTKLPRTSPAIALNPTGNLQGSYHFLSLVTGARICRRRWTELPTTKAIIARVHELTLAEPTYDAEVPDFQFTWGENDPVDDIEEEEKEEEEKEEEEEENEVVTLNAEDALAEDDAPQGAQDEYEEEPAIPQGDGGAHGAHDEEQEQEQEPDLPQGDEGAQTVQGQQEEQDDGPSDESDNEEASEDIEDTDKTTTDEVAQEPEEETTAQYNLRGNKMDFSHKYGFTQYADTVPRAPTTDTAADLRNHIMATGFLFNQMGVKPGVKLYGERAVQAVITECTQLDDKGAYKPRHKNSLTLVQLERTLRAITLVKEKRSGKIKGRTVADGRGQRSYINREDATSPTVSIEGLMISIAIDAKEKRDVATTDVEGAYLHATMDGEDTVIMVYEGDMVDYMVASNPEKYAQYVHMTKSGKKQLYVELLKALYGCIKSALLWYNLFVSTLQGMGFELNPYDPCIANKTINGKQCTICWYVDDLKVSHMEPAVVMSIINAIETQYSTMTVTQGSDHTYVGMDIKFTGNGEAQIIMSEYIKECIRDFPEDCTSPVRTPAAAHLFEVDETCPKLGETRCKLLHSLTAKMLFVTNRARPDVQVPISFLSSRVTCVDEDDWKKLKRMLQYLQGTVDMPLTLSIDNLSIIKTWVDAGYGVHRDMRSQTGGAIMMGKGVLHAKSGKQKINVKSSTEAELVGASDFVPQTIWTRNFIEAQGYNVNDSEFFQDNMSAMKMERNGRQSAGQRSRHINIRYFFIKDRIANGEINLIHCPTALMIADYFTKPLQGALFTKFRDPIMGITYFSTLDEPTPDVLRSVLKNPDPKNLKNPDPKMTSTPSPATIHDADDALPITNQVTWASMVRGQQPLTIKD